nr:MAG TPA: hypothetical protein [Caudoviricetes sp.]
MVPAIMVIGGYSITMIDGGRCDQRGFWWGCPGVWYACGHLLRGGLQ